MNDVPEITDSRNDDAKALLKLAKARFGTLTPAEEKLFRCTAMGEPADYSSDDPEKNDPADADKWGEDRVLCADRIVWLCADRKAKEYITHKGLRIGGARIEGILEFESLHFPYLCALVECSIADELKLRGSLFQVLSLSGSLTGSVSADGMEVQGSVFLREGFRAEGEVRFVGATIGGSFSCVNATFENSDGRALTAHGVKVAGDVFLRDGFRAVGEVGLIDAIIGGTLDCRNATFAASSNPTNSNDLSLSLDRMRVNGSVFLSEGIEVEGELRLLGAIIGGDLDCSGGTFRKSDTYSFAADGMVVKGSVFLKDNFRAVGEVRLVGTIIGGDLDCGRGTFINPKPDGCALAADGAKVKGSIFLNEDFKATGEVRFNGATIGGNIECVNGTLSNPDGRALSADGVKVEGGVFFRDGLEAKGIICFVAASIDSYFQLCDTNDESNFKLVLQDAHIGVLWDEPESWPEKGNLHLHGFVYDDIAKGAPSDAKTRIKWLELQDDDEYFPQPYEQLAAVLKKNGQVVDARDVLIAKEKFRKAKGKLSWPERWLWYKTLGPLIGYGYRPLLALVPAFLIIALGTGFFWCGQDSLAHTGDASTRYPTFNAFMYSVDAFVPIVDFHQVKYRLPYAGEEFWQLRWDSALLVWFWFEVGAGWVISSLLVVGLTRFVRS